MTLRCILTAPLVACVASLPAHAGASEPITAEAAHAIAVDAYLYFYPLITMDITRKQSVNIEPGKELGKGPMNMFVSIPAYPPADLKVVVRINFDTLYSIAWLDLTEEAQVVSAPDTDGRFYLLPMLDMWSDVFASPGWRTTGTEAGNFLVTPPDWSGTVPDGFTRLAAPTPYIWVIGRTKTDGAADYPEVHKIQAGYKVTPLSRWGKPPVPVTVKVDPGVDMKTPPKTQVDTMPAARYFTYAAELLKLHPPHGTDQPILAEMKRIGIEPGKSFDFGKLDPAVRKALEGAPEEARRLMAWKMATIARVVNGWSMNTTTRVRPMIDVSLESDCETSLWGEPSTGLTFGRVSVNPDIWTTFGNINHRSHPTDTMGVYGNYYLKRALVAQLGLGANLPEDAIYPMNLADDTGKPLDGANKYMLHFDKGATPPVNAFWSITLYDSEGFQVANVLNRFAVSSYMPFKTNADGSLDLYYQNESPGKEKEANWLPAPKGAFNSSRLASCVSTVGPKE